MADYLEAIELLGQGYGNPQIHINAYMKQTVQLPVIKNNKDVCGLKQLRNLLESLVLNLRSL